MNEWLSQVIGPGYDELGFLTLGQVWAKTVIFFWATGANLSFVNLNLMDLLYIAFVAIFDKIFLSDMIFFHNDFNDVFATIGIYNGEMFFSK